MSPWLQEALLHGALLCAYMSVIIFGSLRQNPRIWQQDYPPEVRARLEPQDARTRRQKAAWSVGMLVGLVLVFGRLVVRVEELSGGEAPFVLMAGAAYVCFQVFNLFDAVVIDLGLAVWRPSWALIPGVDTRALGDWRWHVRNYLVGVAVGVPFSLLVAGLGWVLSPPPTAIG
jgi:hypothetical protein